VENNVGKGGGSPMTATADLGPSILNEIQRRVRHQQFETWFRSVKVQTCSPETLTLTVPNAFCHEWLKRRYLETIRGAALAVLGTTPRVELVVEEPQQAVEEAPPQPQPARPAPEPRAYYPTDWAARLNKSYRFSNFVVGPSNALAHAAALAISDNPGRAYNPLFLHGGVGLGKTHLIQAITHHLLDNRRGLRVLYLPCESFMNHFIASVQNGEREKFREVYRSLDALLIDDIHFLSRGAREATQEEFFHTFNALYNAGKQIVLSSDCAPRELTKLEERLVSRFKWGLVARLDPPSYEMRVAILRKKAEMRGRSFPDDALHFIAENIDSNIRDLEGAVNKVIAYAALTNRQIALPLVKEALRDIVERVAASVTMDDVIRAVTAEYRVKLSELQSKRRSQSIALPRQIAMYLARSLTRHSLEEIGGYFGGRDHTTVMHACEKIAALVQRDPSLAATIEHLTNKIRTR